MEITEKSKTLTQNVDQEHSIHDLVYNLVSKYLASNKGKPMGNLYDVILDEIEPPLLQTVMERKRSNQLQASKVLGISRSTVRKKLKQHFGNKYFRLTDDE